MSDRSFAEQNRAAWNEVAQVRHKNYREALHDAAFFASGGSILDARVTDAAGDVAGSRILHLMCATGEETMSWSTLGAQVIGVDISDRQIELAKTKTQDAGLSTEFVAADVLRLPREILRTPFDIVYSATGVLVWIEDVDAWASTINSALEEGGRFILWDEHPVAMCFEGEGGEPVLAENYFEKGPFEDVGWSHFAGAEDAGEPKHEFAWTLGEIVTALATSGLAITSIQEYPSESDWRFGGLSEKTGWLPGLVLVVATKK
jgi:2-polyprenyl-3-methyl-5-hydroxy-6-metoxy-1,4-benzoquinol methylase